MKRSEWPSSRDRAVSEPGTSEPIVVGRQRIFNDWLQPVGHELLFRAVGGGSPATSGLSGDEMSADTILTALSLGLFNSTGLTFINVDRGLLLSRQLAGLLPSDSVVEILETIEIDDEVISACRELVEAGYELALDDFVWSPRCEELLELASYIKLDVFNQSRAEVERLFSRCAPYGAKMLAEKVESLEEIEWARRLGFTMFQGYGVGRPEVVHGRAPVRMVGAQFSALTRLLDTDLSVPDLEDILRTDPGLTFQLLQLAGAGAHNGLRAPIRTIRGALVAAGSVRIQGWLGLLLMHRAGIVSPYAMESTLVRARMAETLQQAVDARSTALAYTAGIVSSFGSMLCLDPAELLRLVPMDDALAEAAIHHRGPVGELVLDVMDFQNMVDRPRRSAVPRDTFLAAGAEALSWTVSTLSLL